MKWLSVIASGGLLAILGLLLWFNGKDYCEKAHLKKQAEAVTNAVVDRDEVVNEVVRSSDSDLVRSVSKRMHKTDCGPLRSMEAYLREQK